MTTAVIVIIVIAAVVLIGGVIAWYLLEQDKRRREVREEFGPEYDRTLSRTGDRGKAQKELEERKKRVSGFDLKTLPAETAERFQEDWRRIQQRFVDDPKGATGDADRLVQNVMQERGYPMADFDQRAADISVDHPEVVQNYRSAHQVSRANERGEASTEDLRQAFVHYRALFVELLEPEKEPAESGRGP
jgi:hypothetical protein